MSESITKIEKNKKPLLYYLFAVAVAIAFVAWAVLTILTFVEIKVTPTQEELRSEPGYAGAVKCVEKIKGNDAVVTLYAIEKTITSGGNYYMVKYSNNDSIQNTAYFKYYKSQLTSLTKDIYNHSIQSYIANILSHDAYLGGDPSSLQTEIPFAANVLSLIAEDAGVIYYGA